MAMTLASLLAETSVARFNDPTTYINGSALALLGWFVYHVVTSITPALREMSKQMDANVQMFRVIVDDERKATTEMVRRVCDTFDRQINAEREDANRRIREYIDLVQKGVVHVTGKKA
jgi:hypothetical protein